MILLQSLQRLQCPRSNLLCTNPELPFYSFIERSHVRILLFLIGGPHIKRSSRPLWQAEPNTGESCHPSTRGSPAQISHTHLPPRISEWFKGGGDDFFRIGIDPLHFEGQMEEGSE